MKEFIVFVPAVAVADPGGECDLAFVPPMTRRRFSPLQKVVFSLLNKTAPAGEEPRIVFASRDGEVKLTHEIVETFNDCGDVSAWKFSSSVYNASVGLYSVFAGNRSTYTALAAGDETVENSLIEALLEEGGAVWCYAEETGGGYGASMKIGGVSGRRLLVSLGDTGRDPVDFSGISGFLREETDEIRGKRISLKWLR